MKSTVFNFLKVNFLLALVLIFIGCASVEQTIYLGDVEVGAPIVPPPTHINVNKESGSITISPRFSVMSSKSKLSGRTDGKYVGSFKIDDSTYYSPRQQNLEWNPFSYTAGLDLDIKVSNSVSLFGGINTSGNGSLSLMGGNFGLGLHGQSEDSQIRLDLGFTVQEYDFTAITIVQTKTTYIWGDTEQTLDIYADKGSVTNINPFATLTISSANDSGFFNWFIIGGYFTQNLLGYEPGSFSFPLFFPLPIGTYTQIDKRSDMMTGFLYFSPGITLALNDQFYILLSTKIMKEVVSTSSKQWIAMPGLQINFQL